MSNDAPDAVSHPAFEIGLYSFAELTPDPETGVLISAQERVRRELEIVELAEVVGLDVYAMGEHHRPDFVSSAPAIFLAAAAARTERIRLSSSVTVLSSDDPVRVFQHFAMIDLISGGRAEIMAGRGSFTESFPLFGHSFSDYDSLYSEKLELLLAIRDNEHVTWSGRHRAALDGQGVYPRPVQDPLPIWIASGGTPESVARAGKLGLPMALAIIGGMPESFGPLAALYRRSAEEAGHDPSTLRMSINSHGFLADDAATARKIATPAFLQTMNRIGRERGWFPKSSFDFQASFGLRGANAVGGPDEIIEKILFQHGIFNHQRHLLQLTVGTLPHDAVLRAVELLGTKVAPAVRAEVARRVAD